MFEIFSASYNAHLISNPVKIAKKERKKKKCVVWKFGRIVEGNVLNNILKVPADRR